jgi:hypothetical protein
MSNLFEFFINTLVPRLNDKNNTRFWLPNRLEALTTTREGKKVPLLDPLVVPSWPAITISGKSGHVIATTLANDWQIAILQYKKGGADENAIPDPHNPLPILELSNAKVSGIPNLHIGAITGISRDSGGYTATVPLEFGYYPDKSKLSISADYRMTQHVCSTKKRGCQCDGFASEAIVGEGSIKATLTGYLLNCDLQLTIQGAGSQRVIENQVGNLNIMGETGGNPAVTWGKVTITNAPDVTKKEAYSNLVQEALDSANTKKSLIQFLQQSLNEPGTQKVLNKDITSRVNDTMDSIFGKISPSQLALPDTGQVAATAVDQYVYDRARIAMNDQTSDWYLPRVMLEQSNPVVEPYSVGDISVPDQTIKGLQYTDISIDNIIITGFSNISAPVDDNKLNTPDIDATFAISTFNPGPTVTIDQGSGQVFKKVPDPPLTIAGDFSFTQQGFETVTIHGTIDVAVKSSTITSTITPSGDKLADLTLTLTTLQSNIQLSDMDISISITSESPMKTFFEAVADKIFNSDKVKDQIIGSINKKVSGAKGKLGAELTKIARKTMTQKLDKGI